MANNQNMLEQILTAALSGGGLRGAAPGASGGGAGNLGDMLGSLLGGLAQAGTGSTGQSSASGAGGLGDLLGSVLSAATGGGAGQSAAPGSTQSPNLGGAQGKGMGNLAKYGGIAVIGALAYQALKQYQATQSGKTETSSSAVPPPDSGFHPEDQEGGPEAVSSTLLRAMIAAVQADGVIDQDELQRLTGQFDKIGVSREDGQALIAQLKTRVDPAAVVDSATSPELAVQIYAASALAISVDTQKERKYLDKLAEDIGVDDELKKQIESTVGRA